MNIRRFTEKGRHKFIQFLDGLKNNQILEFPDDLLNNIEYGKELSCSARYLDELDLDDKLSAAKQLDAIITELGISSAENDADLWSWFSAYLFKRLCKKKNGKYTPGELAIWIAEPTNWKRYYRHYLASIWRVYNAHKDKEKEIKVLLTGPVNVPGELWGQIAATETLITNPSMIDAVYRLFWDENNCERKKGAGGNSARRLTRVISQLDKTYDFVSMSGEEIIELLPGEFDRFK